jgi:hypothetical protein
LPGRHDDMALIPETIPSIGAPDSGQHLSRAGTSIRFG